MISSISNFLLLLLLPTLAYTPGFFNESDTLPKARLTRWAVQKTSTIQIKGSTNLNAFGCDIVGYYQPDTISCSEEHPISKLVTLKGELQVDISKFNCHNKMLTRDLRKTLKADAHPTLVIRFLSLERTPVLDYNKDFLRGWVEIELAGICRRFEIFYSFTKTGSRNIQLNGNRSFSFADFKLSPPNKLAGMIKVKDKFHVDFNLLLDPIE